LEGREYVVPDDIKRLAIAVLAHRIVLRTPRQDSSTNTAEEIVQDILAQTPIPQ
jgi:MoxR-like ATPase